MSDTKILSNTINDEDISRQLANFQPHPSSPPANTNDNNNKLKSDSNSDHQNSCVSNNTKSSNDFIELKKEQLQEQQTTTGQYTSETITLKKGIVLRMRKPQLADDISTQHIQTHNGDSLIKPNLESNQIITNQDENSTLAFNASSQVLLDDDANHDKINPALFNNTDNNLDPIPPKPHGPEDKCEINPEFAIICSFLVQFGEKLNIDLDIERLKFTIEDSTTIHDDLIEIHVKLLRKRRKYFLKDQWEKALVKFALEYSYDNAWELEMIGYKDTRPSVKLELLRRLMEAQFDCDSKLKSDVNLCDANNLRQMPMGRDNKGHIYWNRSDGKGNFMIFREWSMDYKSWKAVSYDKVQLDELIDQLEKSTGESMAGDPMMEPINQLPEIFPEYFIQEENKESPPKKGKGKGRGRGGRKAQRRNLSTIQENPSNPIILESNLTRSLVDTDTLNAYPSSNQPQNHQINRFSTDDTAIYRLLHQNNIEVAPFQKNHDEIESQVAVLLNNLIATIGRTPEETMNGAQENHPTQDKATGIRVKKTQKKVVKPKLEELPRRTSSRIQLLQMKKIAEEEEELRKKIAQREVAEAKKKIEPEEHSSSDQESIDGENSQSIKSNKAAKDKKRSQRGSSSERSPSRRDKKRRKKKTHRKSAKGKKKISWDKDDSDLSESSSSSSGIDELDEQDETLKFDDNDDEFACEEEDTNAEPVIIKRARTAGKAHLENEDSILDVTIKEEDRPCGRCSKSDNPEWILLCDRCDDGYHATCCIPPLMFIPDGDWFCPPCEHKMLLEKLYEHRTFIIGVLEAREKEMKKRQRIRQPKPLPVSEPTEQVALGSRRSRNIVDELAEPLALQLLDEEESSDYGDDYEAAPRKAKRRADHLQSRKKDKSTNRLEDQFEVKKPSRTYSRRPFESKRTVQPESSETENSSEEVASEQSSDEEIPMARRAKRQVSYRFKEYDDLINSAIKGDTYDESDTHYGGGDMEEEEEEEVIDEEDELAEGFKSRGKDMATIEAMANRADDPFPPLEALPFIDEQAIVDDLNNKKEIETEEIAPAQDQPITQATNKGGRGKKKKGRRLNDLDSPSGTEVETSDESFIASGASEVEEDDEELISNADGTDTSIDELAFVSRKSRSSRKGRSSGRKTKQNKHSDYVYQESDSDYEPYKKRRASSKRVSYKESTDEDLSDEYSKSRKKKKRAVASSEESEEAWNVKKKFNKDKFVVDDDDDEEYYDDEVNELDDDEEEEEEEEEQMSGSETSQSSPSHEQDIIDKNQVNPDTRQSEFLENKE